MLIFALGLESISSLFTDTYFSSIFLEGESAQVLQYVAMPLLTNAKCVMPHTDWPPGQITSNMLCAGYIEGGKDSCSVRKISCGLKKESPL